MASVPVQSPRLFPDRVKLPLAFDADRMAEDLARLERGPWTEHFVRQNYDGDWSVLPLRCQKGVTHPIMMITSNPGISDYVDTPYLAEAPYLAEVLATFEAPLLPARLMRLGPGSQIKEHSDYDLSAEDGVVRIHVPVTSNPQVEFRVNRELVPMLPGEAWYLRLSDVHSAVNRGDTARVHLVIDMDVNDWLIGMLEAGTA